MKTIYRSFGILILLVGMITYGQQIPAKKQSESILIVGATAHIGNGEIIQDSAIGFVNGKITLVGRANDVNRNDFSKIIEASGKHVYPGFIATNASLGLAEIDAVRATRDFDEVGSLLPHIRSLIAYNAESKVVESMRPNGVLIAQIAPRGGTISGTSSIVQLDAWNWEDAAIKVDDGIHMNWPNVYQRGRWWLGEDPAFKPSKDYEKQVEEIATFFKNAKAYLKGGQEETNVQFQAVKGLFDGSQKLYIHADREKGIVDAVNWAKGEGLEDIVLVQGNEADKVSNLLKQHNIPVLIPRAHRLPWGEDDDVLGPYKLAKTLTDNGLMVAIEMEGQMERMNTRNLPFYAGTYAAYGLDKEKAVQMITLNAAKILGIDDRVGSLEAGKDATLFISEGDALDMRTNIIKNAFIQGREISLATHQTKLWKRYMNKYSNAE
ncbi:amidohydrolase family protein [Sungkyunkwania multivorans]|uniref:Amidohydrolase family protein n=1 Tax=Sungkyunkwania multivorans TaxID=1173618 RepID=A0ABW3CV02_9FLAO